MPAKEFHSDYYTLNDQLGYDDYKDVLIDCILNAETPLTIGIFGEWGSGKTSLMRMMEKELNKKKYLTVWFDAWKFARQESVWRALLIQTLESMRKEFQGKDELKKQVEQLDNLETQLYEPINTENPGSIKIDWKKGTKGVIECASSMIPFGPTLAGVISGLIPEKDKDSNKNELVKNNLGGLKNLIGAIGRERIKIHKRHIIHMEEFQNQFKGLVSDYIGVQKDKQKKHLVIFVDDLDRCLPEKAIQVLESIKLFLEVENTVFVVGVAPEVVQKGIEEWYKIKPDEASLDKEGAFSGPKYLEKIIQLPFRLPYLDHDRFVRYIKEQASQLPEHCPELMGFGLALNPRKAKRILNVFRLQMKLGERRLGVNLNCQLLMKICIIQDRWPEFYNEVLKYPAELIRLETQCMSTLEREKKKAGFSPEEEHQKKEVRKEKSNAETEPVSSLGGDKKEDDLICRMADNPSLWQMMVYELPELSLSETGLDVIENHFRLTMTAQTESPVEGEVTEKLDIIDQLMSEEKKTRYEGFVRAKELTKKDRGEERRHLIDEIISKMRQGHRSPVIKDSLWNVLGLFGDTRPGVNISKDTGLPDILWCHVPEGKFWMGSDKKDKQAESDELPLDELDLPAFYMSSYPVTNVQFHSFVKDHGYEKSQYWTEAIEAKVWRDSQFVGQFDKKARPKPYDFGEPFNLPNHPVVGITWYEALAFCRWIEEIILNGKEKKNIRIWVNEESVDQSLDPGRWTVTLPSEAQWEKGARGQDKRIYPWGDKADPNRANYSDTGIGSTSAVGCFPSGVSPYGLLDMSGNVWEWTRSLYRNYPYSKDLKERENLKAGSNEWRVLRGGSFDDYARLVRCACRVRISPVNGGSLIGFRIVLSPL